MLKPFLQATFIILVFLATLAGCSDPTPAQAPTTAAAPVVAPSLTPAAPEPSETPLPVPTETPGPGAATTPLPANTLEPEGTEAPLRATSEPESLPPGDVIIPLNLSDSEAALSRLSKPEISCLEQAAGPGRLHEILRDTRVPVPEEDAWRVACLGDDTLFGVFVALLLGDPGPLSQETSACLRTGLEWVDLRELMTENTRGREEDDRVGAIFLSGYFTAAACLNEEEWDATAADLGQDPGENAHLSGAWGWNPAMKEEYANYLEDPDHLIAVASRANRSKGARGPEEWMPPDETYWCDYAQDWAEIKAWWELTMTDAEAEAVVEMLQRCENPPDVDVREALESRAGEHKPEPAEELQTPVYGSCQEAEFAGESRFQGSQGGGLGYPKAMVPSARDGDGDGVVCER